MCVLTGFQSDGELENDEKVAALFFNILQDASAVIAAVGKEDPFKRLSINCGQFVYVVTVANETIFVVKKDA